MFSMGKITPKFKQVRMIQQKHSFEIMIPKIKSIIKLIKTRNIFMDNFNRCGKILNNENMNNLNLLMFFFNTEKF